MSSCCCRNDASGAGEAALRLRRLHRSAPAAGAAALRALRRADRLARQPLRRVRRASRRVRLGALRSRVRRAGSPRRGRLEGARPAAGTRRCGTVHLLVQFVSRAGRRPCSFQPATTRRTRSSYATAERAEANATRRPAHWARADGPGGVGAPQRSQSGGSRRGSASMRRSRRQRRSARTRGSVGAAETRACRDGIPSRVTRLCRFRARS